jgi:hypothetical protein
LSGRTGGKTHIRAPSFGGFTAFHAIDPDRPWEKYFYFFSSLFVLSLRLIADCRSNKQAWFPTAGA